MTEDKEPETESKSHKSRPKLRIGSWPVGRVVLAVFVGIAVAVLLVAAYIYAASPAAIRQPQMDHYHFRMQVVVNGKDLDFGQRPFQTPYEKGQCSAELATEPIHFHDQKGQFVHIHWNGVTGGLVLKNYGWNFIGGNGSALGYRLDQLPSIKRVPIHGKNLPEISGGSQFWVYTGDQNGYKKRSFGEFKNQDLEKFFGKKSKFMTTAINSGLGDWFFPKAHAHGGEVHSEHAGHETEEERLTRINNLLGNVVIFVQKTEPSAKEVESRFANLEPLSDSTCGG